MTDTYQLDDEELSRFFNTDREKCIETVYRKYWKELYTYIFSIVKNAHVSEDILQDVFLNIWKAKSIQLQHGSMYAYLLSASKYASYRYLKEKNKILSLELKDQYLEQLSSYEEPNISYENSESEDEKFMRNGLRSMSPKMKEVFILRHFNGFSYKHIAGKLGIAENTVRKQLYNAMKIFRNIINKNI